MQAACASLRRNTTSEVGISIQMWLCAAQIITNPANHTMAFGCLYVTDKSMQLSVTFGRPSRNISREVSHCP
jgi:hypothetical protein